MPDNNKTIDIHAFRTPTEGTIDSSTTVILDSSGAPVDNDKIFKNPTHPALKVDASTGERVESWWHPATIGDVSQGLIDAIFKAMPYKNKNLSWEDA